MFLYDNIDVDIIFLLYKKNNKINRTLMNYKLEKNNIDFQYIEIVEGDLIFMNKAESNWRKPSDR